MKTILLKTIFLLTFAMLLPACEKEKDPALPANAVALDMVKDSALADGKDAVSLEISIDKMYSDVVGTITVSATSGTPSATNVRLDVDGKALVNFRSTEATKGELVVNVLGNLMRKSIRFYSVVVPQAVATVTTVADMAPADDLSANELLVSIDPALVSTIKTCSVTALSGTVADAAPAFDAQGKARVFHRSGQVGINGLIVTVAGRNYFTSSNFTTAWPDHLVFSLPSASLSAHKTEKLGFSVELKRTPGKSSPGLQIVLFARDKNGAPKGEFLNVTRSGTDGKVAGDYWLNDTLYTGVIQLRAAVVRAPGDTTARGNSKVYVTSN